MSKFLEYVGLTKDTIQRMYSQRPTSLRAMLLNTCSRHPDKIAMIDSKRRITYKILREEAEALSSIFQKNFNIKKGDRIAILLPNGVDYAIFYLAIAQLGAIAVSLNTRCSANELQFMIEDAQPRLLIAYPDLFEVIRTFALEYFTPENIITTESTKQPNQFPLLYQLLVEGKGHSIDFPTIEPSDISGLMYTSGTTGRPKGAQISHGNIIANSLVLSICYFCVEDDIDLILVPLFHATGLHGQMMRAIYMGSTCVIVEKFNAVAAMQTIETEKVNTCVAVPTIFWLMMVNPDFDSYDLSSLKRIIYGGSPASEKFIESIHAKFPQALQLNAYGLTECTSVATVLPHSEALRKINSIGLPTPGSEIKIIDEKGNEVNTNIVGELLIKSPQVCQGYWENSKATGTSFKNGWLYTGDLARVDEEGFIYLMDRKKNMIIRGGENIYSIEVENVLYSYPKILEAAVTGVPDEIFGEQVKACVVLKAGEEASEEEIRSHCNQYLADYKVPKYIAFYDELPKNPAGKVIKEKLRD